MSAAIVTFSSDFGLQDSYVAEMKAAFITSCRSLGHEAPFHLLDGSHLLAPYQPRAAWPLVSAFAATFPPGSIHVVVVDPGVGSSRRPIAVRSGRQWFLGPDNGLFEPVLDAAEIVLEIDVAWRRMTPGRTFDGRDLFAPVAARLACGESSAEIGRPVRDPVRLAAPAVLRGERRIEGEIVSVDRFGNLRTNIPVEEIPADAAVRLERGEALKIVRCYADASTGDVVALISSDGRLEIARSGGSAADYLDFGVGARVEVTW